MSRRVGVEVSIALGDAVKMTNVDVVAAYPITPQTHIVEHLAELVADGELDAEYIPVESEHSAMSACMGSAAAGARTFTATAGQGLELMHECLYVASAMRLPVVMAVADRALSAPISVWGDHSDVMACRDTGWIQIFTENGQEVVDTALCAFRIAEDRDVLLPTMIHLDGFHLSHVIEPILMPEQSQVDAFLPKNQYPFALNAEKPVAMGDFAPPAIYTEMKWAQEVNLQNSKTAILKVWEEFAGIFGRKYHPVESYRCDDAKILLLTMGSYSETAMTAIDRMREKNKYENVGLLRLRLWRPFPVDELREAVKNADILIVLDRALSFGASGGPVCMEVKAALCNDSKKPRIVSFVGGLGGRDITVDDFEKIITRGINIARNGSAQGIEMFGVRE